jgi:hypothetical protein
MAFTYTVTKKTTFGDQHVQFGTLVADGTAGDAATGLGVIEHLHVTPKSVTTGFKVAKNAGQTGTSTAGTLAVTGCTSGDEFFVTVYGR